MRETLIELQEILETTEQARQNINKLEEELVNQKYIFNEGMVEYESMKMVLSKIGPKNIRRILNSFDAKKLNLVIKTITEYLEGSGTLEEENGRLLEKIAQDRFTELFAEESKVRELFKNTPNEESDVATPGTEEL